MDEDSGLLLKGASAILVQVTHWVFAGTALVTPA